PQSRMTLFLTYYILKTPFFFCLFAISWAAPAAYGGSQARGLIGVVAASLRQSHSNTGSEPCLRPTPQLTATPDQNLTMEQVVEKNPLVELGGQYWPPDCWTHHHTAVVVPYYGQARHLQHLLFHLHPFLQRQQLHYGIYVVNQVWQEWGGTAFNRGKLRNVGFWEAMQDEDWDCVFFHDVNLLPEDDRNLYICDIFPAHVAVAIDKFNYKLPYRGYLGGVFALRPIHYLRINGFPSTHWGWGREDDDIAARLKLSGMPLLRPHLLFGRYHMLEEGPDPSQEQSPPR
uniref:Beta-1,4-galactosyltransferase 3 n=2 Tax=Sus scrofa TaxID=9823 RepID=A0A8D1TX82_PIG